MQEVTTTLNLRIHIQVHEITTTPAVTISPDSTLNDAIGTMLHHGIGSVIVIDPGPIGILTRSDILRAVYQAEVPFVELRVRGAMSGRPVTTVRRAHSKRRSKRRKPTE